MKEYRSSIRSRKMIKRAFIELISLKPLNKITVADIVDRADLSRNTFYAHYSSVYAVLDEIESHFVDELNRYIDEAIEQKILKDPLTLLKKIQIFIENDLETNRILITHKESYEFCDKIKGIFINRILENVSSSSLKDPLGFSMFLECIASGLIGLYRAELSGEADYTHDDITSSVHAIYVNNIGLYC